jgi:hypothetical protein
MSVSHCRITNQPQSSSRAWSRASRFMLLSIFLIQYSGFEPRLSFAARSSQLRPCQKSPSQKTTIFTLENTISGCPGRDFTFFRNRSPNFHSVLRNSISWRVSRLRFLCAARELASDAGCNPSNDGVVLTTLCLLFHSSKTIVEANCRPSKIRVAPHRISVA